MDDSAVPRDVIMPIGFAPNGHPLNNRLRLHLGVAA
jgi:hypothetical protein